MAAIGRFGPVSAKEVCAHTTVQPDKITRAVDRMVELGFVVRRKDAADGRRIALSLSAAGERAYRDIERVTRRVELALLDVISRREREDFNAILDKLESRAQTLLLLEKSAWRRLAKPRSRRRRSVVTGRTVGTQRLRGGLRS
jgi:DNA-binding MarR family transcriptional regulator